MVELLKSLIDFVLHIDQHLVEIVSDYKTWTYLILFLIIFAETGLVVTPILPGDSLLFAAGAIAVKSGTGINIFTMLILLIVAIIAAVFLQWIAVPVVFISYVLISIFTQDKSKLKNQIK